MTAVVAGLVRVNRQSTLPAGTVKLSRRTWRARPYCENPLIVYSQQRSERLTRFEARQIPKASLATPAYSANRLESRVNEAAELKTFGHIACIGTVAPDGTLAGLDT
jgi:hypothetical protein